MRRFMFMFDKKNAHRIQSNLEQGTGKGRVQMSVLWENYIPSWSMDTKIPAWLDDGNSTHVFAFICICILCIVLKF
jgi:hypothetical protein